MIKKELVSGKLVDVLPKEKFCWDLKVVQRKTSYQTIIHQDLIQSLTKLATSHNI